MLSMHQMNTYKPLPVSFTHGVGAWLYTTDGRKILDALAGIAVSGLGHGHPKLVKAIADQAAKIIQGVFDLCGDGLIEKSGNKNITDA